jgi:alpha-N-arabinofuranosidase
MLKIAVGPGGGEPRFTEWTETVMKGWQNRKWSWDMQGLSLHNYTVINWEKKHDSVNFGEKEYGEILKKTLEMGELIDKHAAIMDKYDPEKKIALVVDEWGAWLAPTPGSPQGYLEQQNSQRDALIAALNLHTFARHADRVRGANIAQMVNVLQAMILTDRDKMVLTPTYHVFHLYLPFHDAVSLPVKVSAGEYVHGDVRLPRVDALAARDAAGKVWLALAHLDPDRPVRVSLEIGGAKFTRARGETLAAPRIDSVNTFQAPRTVVPAPVAARAASGQLALDLAPASVTVVALE